MFEDTGKVSRRSALKQISAVGIGIGAFGTGTATADDGEKQTDYSGFTVPYPDKTVTVFGESVRRVTNHPELLTAPEETLVARLEASDVTGRRFTEAKQYVTELQKQYPTRRVAKDGDTVIQLAPEAVSDQIYPERGNEAESRRFKDAVMAFSGTEPQPVSGYQNTEIGTQWTQDHHKEITEGLLRKEGEYNWEVHYSSDDPDNFGDKAKNEVGDLCDQLDFGYFSGVEDVACDAIKSALDVFASNYTQYHDTDPYISLGPFGTVGASELGLAPEAGAAFYADADLNNDDEKLGWSLHYVQDIGQPLHAGMGMEQAGLDFYGGDFSLSPKNWLHREFEQLVSNNWESDPEFMGNSDPLKDVMLNNGKASYVWVKGAIEDLAGTSGTYANDIYYEIVNDSSISPDDDWSSWDSNTKENVYKDLSNCYSQMGYIARGMIDGYF